jgi:hypothetical protein
LQLVSPYVAVVATGGVQYVVEVERTGLAALVGGLTEGVTFVDGGASREEGVGFGGAAVILEREFIANSSALARVVALYNSGRKEGLPSVPLKKGRPYPS